MCLCGSRQARHAIPLTEEDQSSSLLLLREVCPKLWLLCVVWLRKRARTSLGQDPYRFRLCYTRRLSLLAVAQGCLGTLPAPALPQAVQAAGPGSATKPKCGPGHIP